MCDITMALMATSIAVGAAGSMYQADAQAKAAKYQAQVNEQNAILAQRRAKDAMDRGQIEEARKKEEGSKLESLQKASFAAANIDMSYGSPLDVITSTAAEAQLQAATIRANAEREAEDYEQQGYNSRSSAGMNRARAKNAKTAGMIGTAGTVLSGGAGVFKYRASL